MCWKFFSFLRIFFERHTFADSVLILQNEKKFVYLSQWRFENIVCLSSVGIWLYECFVFWKFDDWISHFFRLEKFSQFRTFYRYYYKLYKVIIVLCSPVFQVCAKNREFDGRSAIAPCIFYSSNTAPRLIIRLGTEFLFCWAPIQCPSICNVFYIL